MGKTLFDKIWSEHVVVQDIDKPSLIYIDLHLIHEVTSPQAFDGLRDSNRKVRKPELTIATVDHNVPTKDRHLPIADQISRTQIEYLDRNVKEFGITYYGMNSAGQGIVHVIGPEQGYTQPGKTIVCGDSHTSTHGAFGALAFGIGTSEVEHVLATQCLRQSKPKTMEVRVDGQLPFGVTAKDIILGVIGQIGVDGAVGHVIEYTGEAIRSLSMEGRMTVCNMSIEAGGRAGMIAPDEITYEYLKGRPHCPKGRNFDKAVEKWDQYKSDPDAEYDKVVIINAEDLAPFVTWGTNPGMVAKITDSVPNPDSFELESQQLAGRKALDYMQLDPGTPIKDISLDRVFIGSCTNSRIEDLRAAAEVVKGYKVSETINAIVVPGSFKVKEKAEKEGLDRVFKESGFEWRDAGCSMCLGMNPDILSPGERCASTSNRNFEGRQGPGGLTHLVSPQMAAAAAIQGTFVDIRDWSFR